jgi:hypothetical protein
VTSWAPVYLSLKFLKVITNSSIAVLFIPALFNFVWMTIFAVVPLIDEYVAMVLE